MKKERKLPTSILIMGRKVKIKQGFNLVYHDVPVLGLCDYDNKTIYIEKNQTQEQKIDTLVHELGHYFLELTGISQKISDSENEIYCQLLTVLFNDLRRLA